MMVKVSLYTGHSKVHAINNETFRSYCGVRPKSLKYLTAVKTDREGHGLLDEIADTLNCRRCRKSLYKYLNPQKF